VRIAITGATGIVGSAVAARLSQDHELCTIGRNAAADRKADLADIDAVKALDLAGIDALIHCAGVVDEDFRDAPEAAMRRAVFGSAALFERAAAAGAKQAAYISSAHVYGPLIGRLDETSPPDPRSDYAIAHFATEQVLKRMLPRFESAAAFRPCAVYGEPPDLNRFRRWSLIPFEFPKAAVTLRAITLKSHGDQQRNFVAASDIAASVTGWLSAAPAGWSICNPVGGASLTIWDFAQLCAEAAEAVTGKSVKLSRLPLSGSPAPAFVYETLSAYGTGECDMRSEITRFTQRLVQEAA
jgi:UDP-glucose 4-epimerase